jgi:choline dehydrogenase
MDYKEVHGSGVQHSPRRMAARSDICAALAPCCHSSERTGPVDSTIADNQRASAARCYLHPVLTRPNLKVITKAIASRVLVKRGRAVGVEYIKNGQVHALRAEREVILSGGAINSPQLLQLSGIGDGDHLRSLGIKVVHELKGVGQNLQDHLACGVKQRRIQPISFLKHTRPLGATKAFIQYALTKTGPATSHSLEAMAFLKSQPDLICSRSSIFFRSPDVQRSWSQDRQ